MKLFKFAGTIPVLALAMSFGLSTDVQASTLVVDRGLPDSNLNNAAGPDRSNVAWDFLGAYASGDTFSLPSTGDASAPVWRIEKLTTWFIAGSPNPLDNFQLDSRFSEISLFLGSDNGTGSSVDRVANSKITGNTAGAANVTITPLTYNGGLDYQGSSGSDIQIWQVDFTNLGKFSAGDYLFSVTGSPDSENFFNHASNAALGGVTADGADDQYAWFSGSASDTSLTYGGIFDSNGNGWDKSSDINIQVTATPVPLPAAAWLLLTAFGGLGFAARRRKSA